MRLSSLPLVSAILAPVLATGWLQHGHEQGHGHGLHLEIGLGNKHGHDHHEHKHGGGVIIKPGEDCGCAHATTTTKRPHTTTKRPATTTRRTTTTTRKVTTTTAKKPTTTKKANTTQPCTTTKKAVTTTTKMPSTTRPPSAPTPCKTVPINTPGDLHIPIVITFPEGHFEEYKHHWHSSCRSAAAAHGKVDVSFTCAKVSLTTAVVTCITKEAGIDIGLVIGGKGDLTLPHKVTFPHGQFDHFKPKWQKYCSLSAGIWSQANIGFSCAKISANTAIVTCIGKTSGGLDLGLSIGGEVDLSAPHLVHFEKGKFSQYKKIWLHSCSAHLGIFGKVSAGATCNQVSATTAIVVCLPRTSVGVDVGLSIGGELDLYLPHLVHFEHGKFSHYKSIWMRSCASHLAIFGKVSAGSTCNQLSATTAVVVCLPKTSVGIDVGLSIGGELDLKLPQLVHFERGHFDKYKARWAKSCNIYAGIYGQVGGGFTCSQLSASTAVVVCLGGGSLGFDLGLSIDSKLDLLTPHHVKFHRGRYHDFKKGWEAACAAYAVKFGAKSAFSCKQTSADTAIVSCARRESLLGHLIGDLTGGLVGHLRLPLA